METGVEMELRTRREGSEETKKNDQDLDIRLKAAIR